MEKYCKILHTKLWIYEREMYFLNETNIFDFNWADPLIVIIVISLMKKERAFN